MSTIPSVVQVCTICLETESKLYVMGKYDLGKAYENLTGYSVGEYDHNMAKFLCPECVQRLVNFSKFRHKSLRARAVLDDLVRKYKDITLGHIKLVDRNKYQLKSAIGKTVLEPDHCDLYIDCSNTGAQAETDPTVEGVIVKNEERYNSMAVEADHSQSTKEDINDSIVLDTDFRNTIIKTEHFYEDSIYVKSETNEYDDCNENCNDNADFDEANDDYLSDSTLILDTRPVVEELLDETQNSFVENTQNLDIKPDPHMKQILNRHVQERDSSEDEAFTKLDKISTKRKKKLQDKLEFETSKNFTLCDEVTNNNNELKSKQETKYEFWETNNEENSLLTKRDTTKDLVKLKKHTTQPYSCTICDYKCKLKISLTVHMRTHKDEKYFSCKYCDFKSKLRHSLNLHMQKHTDIVYCDLCDARFKDMDGLFRHEKIHLGKNSYECHLCDYKILDKALFRQHMRTHTGEKPHACQLCDRKFATKTVLKRHMWVHTREINSNVETQKSVTQTDTRNENYACELCDSRFAIKGHLTRHMKTHAGEKAFVCHLCEKYFSQKVSLERHMSRHTGEKPHSCDTCSYKCTSKFDMVKHERIHTGEKPYACAYCDFRCNRSYTLTTHTRAHTGEKPFSCKLCAYKCTRTSQLVRHMRTHTGEKRFSCHLCDYKCTRQCNLQMHMRVHTGDMLSCDYCPYRTAHKACLVVHIKRHMKLIAEGVTRSKRERYTL